MGKPFDRSEIEPFRCELEPRRDVVCVRPIGELDLATVPVVETQLLELTTAGFAHLVLDLRQLSFLDSSGLKLILTWDAKARADGTSFELVPGPPAVQRLFEVTCVADWLSFADPGSPTSSGAETALVAATAGGAAALRVGPEVHEEREPDEEPLQPAHLAP